MPTGRRTATLEETLAAADHSSSKHTTEPAPFSDQGFNPFEKKLSKGEVERCLHRLYTQPVQIQRKVNAQRDEEVRVQLERAIKPARLALDRGKALGKEYRRQKRETDLPRLRRPSSVPLASRPPGGKDDSTVSLRDDEIELKTADEFVSRFYTERLGRKEKQQERLMRKFLTPMPSVSVTSDVTDASLERLYTRRPRKEQISEAAAKKLYGVPPPLKPRRKETIARSVERLFRETEKEKQEKLEAKDAEWLAEQKKHTNCRKLDSSTMAEAVKRLNTGGNP